MLRDYPNVISRFIAINGFAYHSFKQYEKLYLNFKIIIVSSPLEIVTTYIYKYLSSSVLWLMNWKAPGTTEMKL